MPDNVAFAGARHGADLAAHYASADLFVFPSLTETFGQVVQEAMAAGLPVVGMRAGGVQDIIQHGLTGLLCDPSQPDEWLASARFLAEHERVRRRLSRAARRFAETRSWGALFDRLLAIYSHLVEGGSRDVAAVRG
jgi:glycosyltransferase involved in cell wall biosynthesis